MNSVWAKGTQIGIYSLFGADYFNYCVVFGITFFITKKRQEIQKCLLMRDFFVTGITLGILFMYIRSLGANIWMFITWAAYVINVMVDRNNELILTKIFKILGLIEEDESFDATPLTAMRRRRFSAEFFVDVVEEVKDKKELVHAIKNQDYLYSISYPNTKAGKRKVENYKKFSRAVLLVIYCIREKTDKARLLRDEEFQGRAGVLENFNDKDVNSLSASEDNDEDEISLEDFNSNITPRRRRGTTAMSNFLIVLSI